MLKQTVKEDILKALEKCGKPASVDYIRYNCRISWVTAKSALLELYIAGKISATRTTGGWIFWVDKNKGEAIPVEA